MTRPTQKSSIYAYQAMFIVLPSSLIHLFRISSQLIVLPFKRERGANWPCRLCIFIFLCISFTIHPKNVYAVYISSCLLFGCLFGGWLGGWHILNILHLHGNVYHGTALHLVELFKFYHLTSLFFFIFILSFYGWRLGFWVIFKWVGYYRRM